MFCASWRALLSVSLGFRDGVVATISLSKIILANSIIRRHIREEKVYEILVNIEVGSPEGMQTMNQALADLVRSNIVSKEEVLMKSSNPAKLQQLLPSERETAKV